MAGAGWVGAEGEDSVEQAVSEAAWVGGWTRAKELRCDARARTGDIEESRGLAIHGAAQL
jgi:hypothetical protein